MLSVKDFQAGAHDSVLNVISLSPNDPLDSFVEMWYQVFLWALFSSLLVHIIAALIAFCRLRKHRIGRWIPLAILAMGVLSPLTGGVISRYDGLRTASGMVGTGGALLIVAPFFDGAAIAGVYRASDFIMMPFYALVWGVGQTVVVVFISFVRILATL